MSDEWAREAGRRAMQAVRDQRRTDERIAAMVRRGQEAAWREEEAAGAESGSRETGSESTSDVPNSKP